MRAEDEGAAAGHGGEVVDEYGAFLAQVVANILVMYDFMPDIDRCAEFFYGALDDGDGAFDTGTKAAGVGENDFHGALQYSDDFDFKADRLAGERMVEVEEGGVGG